MNEFTCTVTGELHVCGETNFSRIVGNGKVREIGKTPENSKQSTINQ